MARKLNWEAAAKEQSAKRHGSEWLTAPPATGSSADFQRSLRVELAEVAAASGRKPDQAEILVRLAAVIDSLDKFWADIPHEERETLFQTVKRIHDELDPDLLASPEADAARKFLLTRDHGVL